MKDRKEEMVLVNKEDVDILIDIARANLQDPELRMEGEHTRCLLRILGLWPEDET